MAGNSSYNIVIRDVAEWSKALQADTFQAASRIHLLLTEPDTLRMMEETNSFVLMSDHELKRSTDPLVPPIMKVHNKACELYEQLQQYWKTTPEWASGIELDYEIDPDQHPAPQAATSSKEKPHGQDDTSTRHTDLKDIRLKAKYNNYVKSLIKELEIHRADLGVYPRLLAMESDYKQWVEQQIADNTPDHRPFITEAMLHIAEDAQVQTLIELKNEVQQLLTILANHWRDTDELKSEYN